MRDRVRRYNRGMGALVDHRLCWIVCATCLIAAPAVAQPSWSISPPVIIKDSPGAKDDPRKATSATPAPLRTQEAREREEFSRIPVTRIFVEGIQDPNARKARPVPVEQRFAASLNAGNPEVAGGKIRHGAYYDGGLYWANEPLEFIYLNIVNRFRE